MRDLGLDAKTIRLEEITPDDKSDFGKFYEIYASLFPLEDEREPPEAFAAIEALNQSVEIQAAYGPYREVVAVARLWERGPVIGGYVFGVTTSPAHLAAGIPASIQAIYTFLREDCRGTLSIPDMVDYSRRVAIDTFGPKGNGRPPLVIFEVNNPLRMTEEETADDTAHSGLDPSRRYMFWMRSGFTPLDFPYVQPRLREDAEPVRYLDLFCSNEARDGVPADVLLNHLRAFVSISVLKGREASEDEDFRAMAAWLEGRNTVALLRRESEQVQSIAALNRAARGRAGRSGPAP